MPELFRYVRVPFGNGRQTAAGGSGQLFLGWGCIVFLDIFDETGDTAAAVTFYDGSGANGIQVMDINLAAGASNSYSFALHNMPVAQGLYLSTTSGTISGTLTAYVDHDCRRWLEITHYGSIAQIATADVIAGPDHRH